MARFRREPRPVSRLAFQKASAVSGILAPIVSSFVALSVGYLHQGYSFAEQRLSELGASGAPYATVFNVVGLMTSGMMVVVLSLGLHAEFTSNRRARIGSALLVVCGASLFMTGVFPCDVGIVQASASGILHGIFAAIGTFSIIGASLTMWISLKKDAIWSNHSWFSLGVAAVAVALYLPYQFGSLTQWEGAVQRVLVTVLLVWIEVMSIKLLSRTLASAPEDSSPTSWRPNG